MASLGTLLASFGLDLGPLEKQAKVAEKQLDNLQKKGSASLQKMEKSAFDVTKAMKVLAGSFVAYKTAAFIKDITLMAARYETLGISMRVAGNNAGYSMKEMEGFQRGLQKAGIAAIESRSTLIKMAQAQLDLNRSAELARTAQDAAVIGNINSSEAFERMIHGIQAAQPLILRTIGIQVDFEEAYKRSAKELGRNTEQLSAQEKTQIRANAVLQEGVKIQGIYEAAMTTAGKQLNSLKRHTDNFKVGIGQAFTPALAEIVEQITTGIMGINDELGNTTAIEEWGNKFRLKILEVEAAALIVYSWFLKARLLLADLKMGAANFVAETPGMSAIMPKAFLNAPKNFEEAAKSSLELHKSLAKVDDMIMKVAEKYNRLEYEMSPAGKEAATKKREQAEKELLRLQEIARQEEERKNKLEALQELQKKALEDWDKYKLTLERSIELAGLSDLEKALKTNNWDAEDLITKFKDLEPSVKAVALALIERNRIAQEGVLIDADAEKQLKKAAELAKERSEAARNIYKDMAGYEKEYMAEYKLMIEEQAKHYRSLKEGDAEWAIAIKKWELEEIRKMQEEQLRQSGTGAFDQGWNIGMRDWLKEATNMFKKGEEFAKTTADSMSSSFSSMFFDVMKGEFKSFGDYFQSFADTILKKFTDMLADMVTAWILETAKMSFSGIGGSGGGGGIAGLFSGIFGGGGASVAHSGGVIGRDSFPKRLVNPALFANAPRLHRGLASDEFPAILQKGETVTPRGENALTINVPVTGIDNKQMVSELQDGIEETVVRILRRHS